MLANMRETAVLILTLLSATSVNAYRWFNWEFDVTCEATDYVVPASEAELAAFLKHEHPKGSFIKAVGNGHGLSNLTTCVDVSTTDRDSYILSLSKLRDIKFGHNNTVTFGAGWDLVDIVPELIARKLQPANLCSERVQNFIGAATTGTHGTGKNLGNIASNILAFRVVDAAGNIHVINNETDPDGLKAFKISLGALGIVTEVTLQAEPLQFIKRTTEVVQASANVTEQAALIKKYAEQHDRINIAGPTYSWDDTKQEWEILPTFTLMYWEPTDVTGVYNCSTNFCSNGCGDCSNNSFCYDLAPYSISVPPAGVCSRAFMGQIEHFVPLEQLESASIDYTNLQLSHTDKLKGLANSVAVYEYRFIHGDDAFLSPANTYNLPANSSGIFAAITITYIPTYNEYEALWAYTDTLGTFVSELGAKHNVRPHWNKNSVFNLTYAQTAYPHVDKWLDIEAKYDPKCQFANRFVVDHLDIERCQDIVPTAVPTLLVKA
ncbi:oxidoreductase [Ophiostoma piceae UAMH 11346]|uniref:D-arabinono-1,4-lactone oxidase n=1 Tax=Ophiostoma piceae (strain UAMH 11346) TaxID=1262450 RepID=S3C880_OPHP1|nr:oxidoreductase [Ophiostoma piceae UAMH 11346]